MDRLREHEGSTLWPESLEAAVNAQIGIELANFASYEQLSCFFRNADRGYTNLAAFFRQEADEELKHARSFMDYQTMRGGTVVVATPFHLLPTTPAVDSTQPCLDAYLIALGLEKATYISLLELHKKAESDPAFQDHLEACLEEQLETQKKLSDQIQLLERSKANIGEYVHETVVCNVPSL